ncbi:hypothetical protein ES703_82847 [subsurface metagenome]
MVVIGLECLVGGESSFDFAGLQIKPDEEVVDV